MTDLNALAASLPVDDIARQLGEEPDDVRRAVEVALPALVGGIKANSEDPAGEESVREALAQHDDDVATPPISLADVDPDDGDKITRHIFGGQRDAVVQQLGSTGVSSGLVQKLLPILAPIVLSYLAKQMGGKAGAGGGLGAVLSSILAGAAQGSGGSASRSDGPLGGVLGDVLGGLLGGGRRKG